MRKIYWRPAKIIEDPLTGNTYVLMFGGSGRVRYVRADNIEDPVYQEDTRVEREKDLKSSIHR